MAQEDVLVEAETFINKGGLQPESENPEIFQINREYLYAIFCHSSKYSALAAEKYESSSFYLSLIGIRKFN